LVGLFLQMIIYHFPGDAYLSAMIEFIFHHMKPDE